MSTRRISAAVLSVAAVGLMGAGGFALAGRMTVTAPKSYLLKAVLAPSHEVPAVQGVPRAAGLFKATLTVKGKNGTIAWKLTFAHLSSKAIAAHVHAGLAGKNGPVRIPLCGPCRSGVHGVFSIVNNAKLLNALLHGGAYSNVHTVKHPNGEIRGQVKKIGTTSKPAGGGTSTAATSTSGYTYSNPYGG
jgi:hypothetical protein